MLDVVQLVGNLGDSVFVGQWRIGESPNWLKFEYLLAASEEEDQMSFNGFFEVIKNRNQVGKIQETFSLKRSLPPAPASEPTVDPPTADTPASPPGEEELLTGEGSNQFGDFFISGKHNLVTHKFHGTKQYTTWAADNKTKKPSPKKPKPKRRRKKKEEYEELDASLLVPLPTAPTNKPRARIRIRDFVLKLPNLHFFPYDATDDGVGLARRRFEAQQRMASRPPRKLPLVRVQSPPLVFAPSDVPPAPELFRNPSTTTARPTNNHHHVPSFAPTTTTTTTGGEERVEAKLEVDGSVYEGGTLAGLRHGFGVCGYWNGMVYSGNFRKGHEHGLGEIRDAQDALVFRGLFEYGKLAGFGTMYYSDGAVYQGEMKESSRHGKGLMWYADGSYYDGEFFYNARSGFGKFVDGNASYTGEWSTDVRHGNGRLELGDGSSVEGAFKDNLPDGYCLVRYVGGDSYEGNFKDGLKEGRGTYFFSASKAKFEGRFTRDEAIAKSGTMELEENTPIELPHPADERLSEWLMPIKDPNESHLTAGFEKDGT